MPSGEAYLFIILGYPDKSFVRHRRFRRHIVQRHLPNNSMPSVETPQGAQRLRLTFPEYVEFDTQAIGLRFEFDIKSPVRYSSSITKILSGTFPIPD
jgi:hypothetical protein